MDSDADNGAGETEGSEYSTRWAKPSRGEQGIAGRGPG
jgi:hypothetical protein